MAGLLSTTFSRNQGRTVYPSVVTTPLNVRRLKGRDNRWLGPGTDVYKGIWTRPSATPGGGVEQVDVAVKDLRTLPVDPERSRNAVVSLLREANILANLEHDNILPLFGVCIVDDANSDFCLVTPWVPNFMNLGKFLKQNPHANRHSLLTDVAAGLAYLHSNHSVFTAERAHKEASDASERALIAQRAAEAAAAAAATILTQEAQDAADAARQLASNAESIAMAATSLARLAQNDPQGVHVVHGDLHQGNILVVPSSGGYRAIICDFGISKVVSGGMKATFSYPGDSREGVLLAPELIKDTSDVNAVRTKATDVFAYAFLIYDAYNTPTPTGGVNPSTKVGSQLLRTMFIGGTRPDPPIHEEFTSKMRQLMENCWSEQPDQRPSMDTVLRDLPSCAPRAASAGTAE